MALKKSEINTFRERLVEIRDEISTLVRETNEDVKNPANSKGYSQHQADEGTDDFMRDVTLQISGQECGILRQIERALEKMDEGTYGICDVTNNPIPKARLEAIPYATMTVEAQEQVEKGSL